MTPATAVAARRRAEVEALLNGIVDPCSGAAGTPFGLVDMGMVERLEVDGDAVEITLMPTYPGCRFLPIFDEEIRRRASALSWCERVTIDKTSPTEIWDEGRLSEQARAALQARRARVRATMVELREGAR